VYFEPLYVTDAPVAYAAQFTNAATPEQLTCADAELAAVIRATIQKLTISNFLLVISDPPSPGTPRVARVCRNPFQTLLWTNLIGR
jgi:hypothetical protein